MRIVAHDLNREGIPGSSGRHLIGEIVLNPEGRTLAIEVKGDLAGILSIAGGRKLAPKFPNPGRKSEESRSKRSSRKLRWLRGRATISTCDV
jgi:hypothetical protein